MRVVVDCNGAPSVDPKGNIDKLTDSGMLVRDEAEFLKGLVRLATPTARTPASARVTSPGSGSTLPSRRLAGSWLYSDGDSCRSCSVKRPTLLVVRIIAAHKRGLSIEQAINQAVNERLSLSAGRSARLLPPHRGSKPYCPTLTGWLGRAKR